MSTVLTNSADLAAETRTLEQALSAHFDSLTAKGADQNQILFAKMQLLNARMMAVDAIYKGKATAEEAAKKELL